MVVVQKLEGGEKLTPNADGVYTLPVVNSDITIIITLTPPIVVTVEEALYGTLTVTRHSNGQTVPDNSGKNSITVEKNEYIRLDTRFFTWVLLQCCFYALERACRFFGNFCQRQSWKR